MYKLFLLSMLFFMPSTKGLTVGIDSDCLRSSDAVVARIEDHCVRSSPNLDPATLYHFDGQFFVAQNKRLHLIEKYNVDEWLRPVKTEQLEQVLQHAYLQLVQASDGEFILRGHVKGLGGGTGGATVGWYIGKFTVSFIGHGAIVLVSGATGPFAEATFASLESTFGPLIESTSVIVAAGTAIAGGVLTGPV